MRQYSYLLSNGMYPSSALDKLCCPQMIVIFCLFIVFMIVNCWNLGNIYVELLCLWFYFVLLRMMWLYLLYPSAYCWDIALHQKYFKSVVWMLLFPIWWNYGREHVSNKDRLPELYAVYFANKNIIN